MVVVSYSGKEINAKLVYYGPGLCGKTTNLEAIYEAVPDTSRGKMVSMKTQSDRTLFFDLLPLDLGEIMGFKTRFLLYTVPGQVFYNATRKLVLKGADAIVFVADSEVGKMEENRESLANLRTNLAEYNIDMDSIPWVLQYNKRDLPNIYTVEEMNAELNPDGRTPWFEAVARDGRGVFETFRGVSHQLMEKVTKDLRRAPNGTSRPSGALPPSPPQEPERPAPAPVAPVQAIRHEMHTTAAPLTGGDTTRLDEGRTVEVPEVIPAPALAPRAQAPAPAPQPEPVAAVAPAGPPVLRVQLPAAAATPAPAPEIAPAPQSVLAPAPAALAPAPAACDGVAAVAGTEVVSIATVAACESPAPAAEAPVAGPPAAVASPEVVPVVVPVRIARGGTYEIVIRLQIDAGD